MCFGSSEKDSGENLAPRPANGASSTMAHDSKASYPPQQQQQQQQYAPPTGPRLRSRLNPTTLLPRAPLLPTHNPKANMRPRQALPASSFPAADPIRTSSRPASGRCTAPGPIRTPAWRTPIIKTNMRPSRPPPGQDYAPPAGPPPKDPKPQHDWEIAVPDTSLFPPPPAFFSGWDRSPANNATEEEAERGAQWCQQYPLTPPITLDPGPRRAPDAQHPPDAALGLHGRAPPEGRGPVGVPHPAHRARQLPHQLPPLYAVTLHSPLASGRKHTVYYEVHVRNDSRRDETSLALGFTALPYPNFRLPGWHRGSMAIHGDDGHRYVNDTWGGQSFTAPFKRGDTYGVGMTFEPVEGRIITTCFFTRNGVVDGEWNLHEEQDSDVILPVTGLEGYHDLGCAIGSFNHVAFDVIFDPNAWKYRPS
ncbi:unnamed protein product [Parascedosporium putredinis]|uniref:SPRY domain-containing protein n=1 Tax=Parascedosporium putredinis TaxID=1442378 RepID=A0A9P1H800_9PEZI|nr:unnamed protein product [Parascedosporium putredinis]CAI8001929.1 unnamed protein product [Parascedosporium putredinis]